MVATAWSSKFNFKWSAFALLPFQNSKKGGKLIEQSQKKEKAMSSDLYIDPNLECDAPTFVDFTNITSQYDDNADAWFGKGVLLARYS